MEQGEIVIGVEDVGSDWYLGRIDSRKGIFPLTHVWQLDSKLLKVCYVNNIHFKSKRTYLKSEVINHLSL